MGHSGVADTDSVNRLKQLLSHADVRVRVAAAIALWRLTSDTDVTIPILRAALTEEDNALPLGFVYPSNQGASHRMYILRGMYDMRRQGVPVLNDMIGVMESAGMAKEGGSYIRPELTALTALSAIAESGPVSQAEMSKIREITTRKGFLFQNHGDQDLVQRILGEITVRDSEH